MKLLRIAIVAVIFGMTSSSVLACPSCFGAKGDPVVESIGWAILFLLVMITAMVGGIIAFFINIAKRSRIYEQQLQEGTAEWGKTPELMEGGN